MHQHATTKDVPIYPNATDPSNFNNAVNMLKIANRPVEELKYQRDYLLNHLNLPKNRTIKRDSRGNLLLK